MEGWKKITVGNMTKLFELNRSGGLHKSHLFEPTISHRKSHRPTESTPLFFLFFLNQFRICQKHEQNGVSTPQELRDPLPVFPGNCQRSSVTASVRPGYAISYQTGDFGCSVCSIIKRSQVRPGLLYEYLLKTYAVSGEHPAVIS